MKLRIFTLALLPLTASAQLFTFGVQGGVPAQTPRGRTDEMPFVLGPSVNIRAFAGVSLQTGVLYHRIGRGNDSFAFLYPENAVTLGFESWRGSALELPFLAKFRFLGERAGWRPFLLAGPHRAPHLDHNQFGAQRHQQQPVDQQHARAHYQDYAVECRSQHGRGRGFPDGSLSYRAGGSLLLLGCRQNRPRAEEPGQLPARVPVLVSPRRGFRKSRFPGLQ